MTNTSSPSTPTTPVSDKPADMTKGTPVAGSGAAQPSTVPGAAPASKP